MTPTDLFDDPREKEIGDGPHIWVQWKGTSLCADFHCACGAFGHIDADFCYAVRCPLCGALYQVGMNVRLYPCNATLGLPIIPDGCEQPERA